MQPTPSDPYQQYTYGYAPAAPDRLLAHSKFVVDQKAKLIELRNEYSIYDESGNRIGSVMQVGQSFLTRLLRLVLKGDSLLGVKLEIREANGAVALLLHKPAFRITCAVSRPNGTVIGRIAAKIRLGKARMAITDPAERVLGEVRAENLRAWNFNVQDATGRLIARVDKKWADPGRWSGGRRVTRGLTPGSSSVASRSSARSGSHLGRRRPPGTALAVRWPRPRGCPSRLVRRCSEVCARAPNPRGSPIPANTRRVPRQKEAMMALPPGSPRYERTRMWRSPSTPRASRRWCSASGAGRPSTRWTGSRRSTRCRRVATWERKPPPPIWRRSISRARGWRVSRCAPPGWGSSTSRPGSPAAWAV